jgi:hypothetical protein
LWSSSRTIFRRTIGGSSKVLARTVYNSADENAPKRQLPARPHIAMTPKSSVEFIRIFFKSPTEGEFAVECAEFIAGVIGERVLLLRPDTKWSEILQWFGPKPVHGALFAMLLKKKFGRDVDEIITTAEFMTFREFVEYVCRHERSADS